MGWNDDVPGCEHHVVGSADDVRGFGDGRRDYDLEPRDTADRRTDSDQRLRTTAFQRGVDAQRPSGSGDGDLGTAHRGSGSADTESLDDDDVRGWTYGVFVQRYEEFVWSYHVRAPNAIDCGGARGGPGSTFSTSDAPAEDGTAVASFRDAGSDAGSALHDAGDAVTAFRDAITEFSRAVTKDLLGHVPLRDPVTTFRGAGTALVLGGATIAPGVNDRRDAVVESSDRVTVAGHGVDTPGRGLSTLPDPPTEFGLRGTTFRGRVTTRASGLSTKVSRPRQSRSGLAPFGDALHKGAMPRTEFGAGAAQVREAPEELRLTISAFAIGAERR